MTRRLLTVAAALATLGATSTAFSQGADQNAIDYHVTHTVPLGAPDRWDYVVYDPASHSVYVAHGDRVTVVDGQSGAVVGQVQGMHGGTHGVAISHAAGLGYTDDGEAGQAVALPPRSVVP